MSGAIILLGIKGIGRVANEIVNAFLQVSTGLRYTAIVSVISVLCLTIVWSLIGRNKFFPKDGSYMEVQSKAILKSLKKEPMGLSHTPHLPSFEARKLQYLQRPTYLTSQLT
jgi:hypothetical protein